jgi:VWFA-related protein
MKIFVSTAFLFFSILLTVGVSAQNPQTTPPPKPANEQKPDESEIVRISSELVLVDALVLDKAGKQVTDLTAEDFEVWQDGKPQKITNFTYINSDQPAMQTAVTNSSKIKSEKKPLPVPPISLRSNRGRVITFVIDDGNCLATIEGTSNIRNAVKKFINEQMQPDDKVAIYRTRGGSSLLQMYTSNKEVLKRVVDKVIWLPSACGTSFDPKRDNSTMNVGPPSERSGAATFESKEDKEFREANENRERENQVIGSVGVLGFVIDRLKNLPERKVVFLLSEGIFANFGTRANDALRELADKATRASVVVNTLSAKGVSVPGFLSAQDEVLPGITGGVDQTIAATADRIEEERALNAGLAYLSYTTGGKFVSNQNYLDNEIKEILDTEKGYYLLGYQPDDETFKGKGFHRIEVRLKRPELKISSRKGFYGRADAKTATKGKTAESPLYQAISSPLRENGMDIRLTTLVGSDAKEGGFIRAIFHVKGPDLTFIDEADGVKRVVLDVVAVALDEKGKVIEEFNRSYPIRIPKQGVQTVMQNGLDYSTDIPIKKSGFYSFRLAVRDSNSKRLGSAGDFVEVPDLKKADFLMSALITTTVTNDGKPLLPKSRPVDAAFTPVFVNSIPSIRQYTAGSVLAYSYNIYNAKLDAATRQPKLTRQIRVFKNGKLLIEGKETPVEPVAPSDMARIESYGFMKLNADIEPGEYFLQVVVRDTIANKTTSQWIDFEIVR